MAPARLRMDNLVFLNLLALVAAAGEREVHAFQARVHDLNRPQERRVGAKRLDDGGRRLRRPVAPDPDEVALALDAVVSNDLRRWPVEDELDGRLSVGGDEVGELS